MLLLFLFLEGAALLFYTLSDSYTQAKILGFSSNVIGTVGSGVRATTDYFSLRSKNELLLERVMQLEQQLALQNHVKLDSLLAANSDVDQYIVRYISARVVSNSISKRENYILINQGLSDGVREQMAILTPRGEMVGYVVGCSEHFSVVISVLNTKYTSSGKLFGDSHAGSITWDGADRYQVQLRDLSKYTPLMIGSEVVSTSFSQIFPDGVKIGRIVDFTYDKIHSTYWANVELAADISAIDEVLVVNCREFGEGRMALDEFINKGHIGLSEIEPEVEMEIDDEEIEALLRSVNATQNETTPEAETETEIEVENIDHP